MSGNNNIRQGVSKFKIIGKWRICCVWDNGQDFSNFEESLCQGMLFDVKSWTCYWKDVFSPYKFLLPYCHLLEMWKIYFPICNRKNVLRMGHLFVRVFISSVSQIIKAKTFAKILGLTHPFDSRFTFLYHITCLGTRTLQSCWNLDHCSIDNKFLIYW